jgi:Mrp family chromosome partitioning ATPase
MSSHNSVNAWRLGDYVQVLRRQWLIVILGLIVGVGAALAYLHWAPQQYSATTAVLVTPIQDPSSATTRNGDINLDTEAQLVTSGDTATAAAVNIGQPQADADLIAGNVSVTVPPNTDILDIAYTARTASAAQRGSMAFAQAYLSQRQQSAAASLDAQIKAVQAQTEQVNAQLQQVIQAGAALDPSSSARARNDAQASALNSQLATLGSQQNNLRATIVSPGRILTAAALPTSPSSPNPIITLAAGVVLGLILGFGVAYLRHRADDVVRNPDDLFRRTGVPVAAVLSTRLHADQVNILPPMSSDGRGYARLRNLVTSGLLQSKRRVVIVAGVRHGGGPVAANLAASLARAGEDVFLVCADVFGATSAALLGAQRRPGLAEVLVGETDLDQAVHTMSGIPNMRVLGAGRDPDRADALLQTRSPRKLIDRMLDSASYVVIEAPATSHSPDAQTLANVAELAVLVVEVGHTGARETLDACAQFESMGTPVLGAVIARYGKDGEHAAVQQDVDEEVVADASGGATSDHAGEPAAGAGAALPGEGTTPVSGFGQGAVTRPEQAPQPERSANGEFVRPITRDPASR